MACLKERENLGGLLFKETKPFFYKIVLNVFFKFELLPLPREFMIDYGDLLENPSKFKLPGGDVWEMEVERKTDDLWLTYDLCLTNGWKRFAEHYSLVKGCLLSFEFDERTRSFNMNIFDETGSEISYPYRITSTLDTCSHPGFENDFPYGMNDEFKEDENVVDLTKSDDEDRERKKRAYFFNTPSSDTRTRTGVAVGCKESSKIDGSKKEINRRLGLENSASKIAAAAFKSDKPYFIIEMRATYIHAQMLYVPLKFGRYFVGKDDDSCVLIFGKKEWTAHFFWSKNKSDRKVRIYRGWKEFSKENHLKVGDACVFELIEESDLTFNIAIFRAPEGSGSKTPVSDTGGVTGSRNFRKQGGASKDSPLYVDSDSDFESSSDSDNDDSSDETFCVKKSLCVKATVMSHTSCKRKLED